MTHKEQIVKQLRESVDELYVEFSKYPRPQDGIVTCLDFRPTEEEAIEFAKPLKEIPREYINHLEFYDEWGTTDEVKYLIPRILECYVEAAEAQEYSVYWTGLQFIRYKLADLDDEHGSKWSKHEAALIKRFLLLFQEYLSNLPDDNAVEAYLGFMDALCLVLEDIDPCLAVWQRVPDGLKSKQIEAWLNTHLNPDTFELSPPDLPAAGSRAEENQNKIKEWVLGDENVTNNVDLFSKDPWFKLVLQ